MKLKKAIIVFLLIVLLVSQFSWLQFANTAYASENSTSNQDGFHYNQLGPVAKKIYEGIYAMYTQGILETGTESYDLVDNGYFTEEEIKEYGNSKLVSEMNAARYAFYADYPEVFYVQFQALSLRTTISQDGKYHVYIGSGKYANYYVEGFTNKEQVAEEVRIFNNKVDEIVQGAKEIKAENGTNLIIEQIKYVHNEIINTTGYRLESDCVPGNEGFLGTPYGALVKEEAVCEGYARSLKTVLDKLGINSILVQGVHQSEGSAAVPHMWNYVEIEKETKARSVEKVWYAIDATMDDPFLRDSTIDTTQPEYNPGDDIVEGFENTRYCMLGKVSMSKEHTALETVEAAGDYTFKYPTLEIEDYGVDSITNNNGLLIKFKQEGTETEEYKAGDFYISYNNKGYAAASEEGKYILMKYHEYRPGDEVWREGNWGYMNPEMYAPGAFRDYGDYLYITVPNSEYVEFAVTTLAPGTGIAGLTYQGDESDFVAQSGKLYNPNGTYKSKPYIKTQTPPPTASLTVGPTYHVDVTYEDDLVLANGATEAGYKLDSTGPTGADEAEITNFVFDGKNRVTFDLKFSKMWADDGATYHIYLTGLVGKNSGKEPMEITYGAYNLIACSFSMNKSKNWEVYARPTLIETEDLSLNGWETSDGTPVSEKLKSRIALVTTKTTKAETEVMNDLIEDKLPDQEVLSSETYNISLNVCKKYVVKTGHRLKLSVGFPAGYGPDDAGVTFKAYHFMRDDAGNVTGVEEIPCVVTQYGLIITCNAFSPFAIAAVENDGTNPVTEKAVIVSSSENGQIEGANREEGNIFTLSEGESRTLTFKANEGYEVEKITACGQVVDLSNVEDKSIVSVTINYDNVSDKNSIVDASFVAKTVVEKEEERGEVVVEPTATPAEVSLEAEKITVTENESLIITSNVKTSNEGIHTYQWYKNGVAVSGQTNPTLEISAASKNDEGEYKLVVTTTVDTVSVTAESNICTVTVSNFGIVLSQNTAETVCPGEEFEVTVSFEGLNNVENGIIAQSGRIEFDSSILEMRGITAQNGWNMDSNSFNPDTLQYVLENSRYVTEDGMAFKIRFKVKEDVAESLSTLIKVKDVVTSNGEVDIIASDAEIEVNIGIDIESDVYTIDEEYVSRIVPNTTVSSFKQNIISSQELIITDVNGNIIGENDLVATGMKLKVGANTEFTLVVTGDIDGNGKITVTDLAKIKMHQVSLNILTGEFEMAADVNGDGSISATDIAQIKLVIVGLKTIQ